MTRVIRLRRGVVPVMPSEVEVLRQTVKGLEKQLAAYQDRNPVVGVSMDTAGAEKAIIVIRRHATRDTHFYILCGGLVGHNSYDVNVPLGGDLTIEIEPNLSIE